MKYLSTGFHEDAGKLLKDFANENSLEYTAFAEKWKKHNFSLIFMGRADDHELTEFTSDILRVSTQFLSSVSFLYQAGAIYLIYSLYRNQISDPFVQCRIEFNHWRIIDKVRLEAMKKGYKHLHHVIYYLIKYSVLCITRQTLRGPVVHNIQKVSKSSETIATLKASFKADLLEYKDCSNLPVLSNLYKEYLNTKKDLDTSIAVNRSANPDMFDYLLGDIDNILNSSSSTAPKRKGRSIDYNIGQRRSELKKAAFSKKSVVFRGRILDSEESDVDDIYEPIPEKVVPESKRGRGRGRGRGQSKKRGKVGRPRKNVEQAVSFGEVDPVDVIDVGHLLKQQEGLYEPEDDDGEGLKNARFAFYKLSPKYCDEDSD